MDTSRYCKRPSSLSDLMCYGGDNLFVPLEHSLVRSRQWSSADSSYFYATVPDRLRPLFRRSWSERINFITRASASANDHKLYPKVFIGQFVLALARLTRADTLRACSFFAGVGAKQAMATGGESGACFSQMLAMAGYQRQTIGAGVPDVIDLTMLERLQLAVKADFKLPADGDDQIIAHRVTGRPLTTKLLNNWCYEASVPDPLDCLDLDAWSAEVHAAMARYLASSRFPKSRIRARAWLTKDTAATPEERSTIRDILRADLEGRALRAGVSVEVLQADRAAWTALEKSQFGDLRFFLPLATSSELSIAPTLH